MVGKSFWTVHRPGGKIHIHLKLGRQFLYAADMVYVFHIFRIIKPSRAFGEGDIFYAVFGEPADHGFDYQRMGGYGKFRFFCHNQIGFNNHF